MTKYTIGPHGSPWTPDTASKEAKRLVGLIESGIDPMRQVQAERAAGNAKKEEPTRTVRAVFDRFDKQHLQLRRSGTEVRRIFERNILPIIGAKPIDQVVRRDIIGVLDAIEERGAPYARNRAYAHLRKFLAWCVQEDEISTNPAAGLNKLPEESRDRVLEDLELRAVWNACDPDWLGEPFGAAIRLMILTGQRREEVAGMRWAELDLDAAVWTIPKERAKNGRAHDVALAPVAVAILRQQPRVMVRTADNKDGEPSEFVFTTTGSSSISGWSRMKIRLDEITEVADWTLHDLRRTLATGMAELGISREVVEAVLNHKSGAVSGVAAVYNRYAYAAERKAALNAWARRLDAIVNPGQADSNVVALRA